jgi:tripartite-type tricarboxylate transporter receptor subunit TctC
MMTQFRSDRRRFVGGVAGLGVAAAMPGGLRAQDGFPSETVNVVTHAGAGGGTDITTRMMMLRARRHLGVDMQVVNKRGGSGSAALMYVDQQPRDGYTVMAVTQSHIFQIIQGKVPLAIEDVVGIARATDDPMIIAVPGGSDIKTMEQLLDASNAAEGGLKWGTTFAGGADHVAIHNFTKKAGIPYTIVPFQGGGDIVTNLVGGNVEVALLNYAEGESQFGTGDIRPVAALSAERLDSLQGTPTARELGIDAIGSTIRGFAALAGVSAERIAALEEGMVASMNEPVYQSYLASGGMPENSVLGSEAWTAEIRRIHDESRSALEELGML